MSDLRQDIMDLHSWGNTPKQIANVLGLPYERIWKAMVNMGLVKKSEKRKSPPPMQTHRVNAIKQLDVQIQFHQRRAQDLTKYRNQLAQIQETGAHLQHLQSK